MKHCDIKKLVGDSRAGKWWENIEGKKKGEKQWDTLQHNGIYFPEPYIPLPKNINILYKNKPIILSTNIDSNFNISAEEAAVFFAQMVDRDERLKSDKKRHRYSEDEVFINNFWKDWKKILGSNHEIQNIKDVDFKPVAKYLAANSESKKITKKSRSKEEKLEEKEQKEHIKELYGYAIVDGVKIDMEYTVEPPGLYQGHGGHPLRGKIKRRLTPLDITLNVSKSNIPQCYIHGKPCKWGDIVENKYVTWIASWKHPITGEVTYKWLKRTESHFVCASDMLKFDKARTLDKHINSIRKQYMNDLTSSNPETRQSATAVYLLDRLAIRPGIEKDEAKEAGTLGLTTLMCENVTFNSNNEITVDFIGKSSIKFVKTFDVDERVYNNLKRMCKSSDKTKLFPNINATTLNGYLKTLLSDLTAKVFRTWKASSILQKELLKNIPKDDDPIHTRKLLYDSVNLEVAKALNHKRMTTNDERIDKIKDKIKELKNKEKEASTEKQKSAAKKSREMQEAKLEEAEENVALGTSKLNYLDPRITVAWAKLGEVPIEKIYNKTQLKKFVWAMDVKSNWKF